jgi:hypothetical protein
MTGFPETFWSSHEISFICKQESACGVNWVMTDLWYPDNNSERSLKAESAQMCYLFEGMTWDARAFSSEKGKGEVGGSRMGTKRKQDCKSGKTVFMGVLRKELKHTVIQKYFFPWNSD